MLGVSHQVQAVEAAGPESGFLPPLPTLHVLGLAWQCAAQQLHRQMSGACGRQPQAVRAACVVRKPSEITARRALAHCGAMLGLGTGVASAKLCMHVPSDAFSEMPEAFVVAALASFLRTSGRALHLVPMQHTKSSTCLLAWLTTQLALKRCSHAAGPPGSGKSTVVHTLAKQHGCSVVDWQPPVPVLWHEHRHNVSLLAAPLQVAVLQSLGHATVFKHDM